MNIVEPSTAGSQFDFCNREAAYAKAPACSNGFPMSSLSRQKTGPASVMPTH